MRERGKPPVPFDLGAVVVDLALVEHFLIGAQNAEPDVADAIAGEMGPVIRLEESHRSTVHFA